MGSLPHFNPNAGWFADASVVYQGLMGWLLFVVSEMVVEVVSVGGDLVSVMLAREVLSCILRCALINCVNKFHEVVLE